MSEFAESIVSELSALYEGKARQRYGLTQVNQRAHALQAASKARELGLGDALVVAALLHDIGHMIHPLGDKPSSEGIDDHHEVVGADWLERYFGADVTEPIRLHVQAKRYLCTVERGYLGLLSSDSVQSLALQGGLMSDTEVAAFRMTAGWREALSLRRIDELAKDPDGPAPEFGEFADALRACARPSWQAEQD